MGGVEWRGGAFQLACRFVCAATARLKWGWGCAAERKGVGCPIAMSSVFSFRHFFGFWTDGSGEHGCVIGVVGVIGGLEFVMRGIYL
jgi:hypothetical protein